MTRPIIPEKILWGILASLGLAVPALILLVRLALVCLTLELRPVAFLPLSGLVNGRDPQLFTRIMLNLTHPVFLLLYAFVLTFVAARSVGTPLTASKSNRFLFCGVALVHFTCLALHTIALYLPIGDMVEILK
jgi:hypothetical protein